MVEILLVEVAAISQAETKPAARINLDTTEYINGIVVESIRRVATDVGGRSNFGDWLDVLVKREIETDAREKLIRPVQQNEITAEALRITVQDIAAVR